ncbi:MAG: DHA2 family efflux MFS transporter permease subunit [Oscillospiraceae bacterium]|nr:DHA2 family efflux MFS transporter permease subunit [Oscillospiraceae bacterium]
MSNGAQISSRKRTLILINIIISCVATTLLMTALNTALPTINTEMGIETSLGQWLISGYSLTMGIVMPLSAFLVRRVPTKWLYLGGLGFVLLGLLIGLFSSGFEMLMAGRVLQACGDGVLLSMSQVVIMSIFPSEKRGSAMGWYGLAVGAAPVVAPTLGGILVDAFGWRSIFLLVLIIVAAAFIMALLVFSNVLENVAEKFDLLSFVLSVITFGGITLGVGDLANYGFFSIATWLPLAIGVVVGVFFVYRQLHVPEPFLNLRVFQSRKYTISVITVVLVYFTLMGASILMPQYVQNVMHQSATVSGLVVLPGALVNAVISPFAGRIYDRIGMKKLFLPGAILMVLTCIPMFLIGMDTPLWVASLTYAVRSLAIGGLLMPLVTWGTASVPKAELPDATALISSLRTIGGAIGNAVFIGFMTMVATGVAGTADFDEAARMQGFNISFLIMAGVSLVLLLVGILGMRDKKSAAPETSDS